MYRRRPALDADLVSLWITIKLATVTTFVLVIIGTPIAWWLAHSKNLFTRLAEPVIALPVVLPPTVVGFYLLIAFSPEHIFGQLWMATTGTTLAFSFSGLVIGSVIYSMPFYVQPLQVSFSSLQDEFIEAAATLGAGPVDRFFNLIVPLCKRGFMIAICLAFAHTIGEFGIVLMIGGNIPDETRVLSIALFDHVESLEYGRAHTLAAGLLIFSFVLLVILYSFDHRWRPFAGDEPRDH